MSWRGASYKVGSIVLNNLKPVCKFVRKASEESAGAVQPWKNELYLAAAAVAVA